MVFGLAETSKTPNFDVPLLQNEFFRCTHLYNICMGFGGGSQSFFEKFFRA